MFTLGVNGDLVLPPASTIHLDSGNNNNNDNNNSQHLLKTSYICSVLVIALHCIDIFCFLYVSIILGTRDIAE